MLATAIIFGCAPSTAAQVYELAAMTADQIRGLDRSRTAIVLPGGIMEQHGPHLPAYADGYWNERIARELAESIAARAGWTAVLFPPIPLGTVGANAIGRKFVAPGTYAVRSTTPRAVFMDLASDFGDQGFRWIFAVHEHGGIAHNSMLDEAGDFFRDTYGGQLVHLMGLEAVTDASGTSALDPVVATADGLSIHAGAAETSGMLFLRPDLVRGSVGSAPDQRARTGDEIETLAARPEWRGYFGAPRLATAAQGARGFRAAVAAATGIAARVLDGLDPRTLPRVADILRTQSSNAALARDVLAAEAERRRKQEEWLARREALCR